MKYKVIWSEFAELQLDKIFEYYYTEAGDVIATRIIKKIISRTDSLVENPFLGVKEELLSGRAINYRYLVYTNYKIIYSVDEIKKLIKIADIFDTRQNPIKLKRNK